MSGQQSAPFPGLPAEVKVMILLWLDGGSLHTCRQVSSSWDQFIRREVWARQLERRHAQPARSTVLTAEGISSETHLIKLGVEKLLTVDGKFE